MAWCERTWSEGRERHEPFTPERVATPTITRYRDYLQNELGRKPATINRYLVSLKRYFDWATGNDVVTRDPARVVKLMPQIPQPPRHLTDKEEADLMAAVNSRGKLRDRALIILMLHRSINQDRIRDRWDDLLRVAVSLKLGWVTASLLIGKLQAFPRQNALTRALQEYGRLAKTLFILRYLRSEAYRRQIGIQLNKGEALHALRRFLFFANYGRIRRRQPDEQTEQAGCLNLVTNAVVAWNTVYMAEVIRQLEAEGYPIEGEDLVHLSPARYEHINPYGKYHFDIEGGLKRQGLRSLRKPAGS